MCIVGESSGLQKLFGTGKKKKWKTSNNVATSGQQKKKSRSDPTSRRSHDFWFIIIKNTGDLILGVIEERTDGVRETKQ